MSTKDIGKIFFSVIPILSKVKHSRAGIGEKGERVLSHLQGIEAIALFSGPPGLMMP